jgi:hypothetical protein
MKDDIRNLYSALVKNGYSIDDLGGSEENFRANMRDEKIRGEFYDWVVGRDDFNIGSRDAYEKRMTGALNPTAEQGIIPELLGVPYPAPEVDKSQYTFTGEQLGLEDPAESPENPVKSPEGDEYRYTGIGKDYKIEPSMKEQFGKEGLLNQSAEEYMTDVQKNIDSRKVGMDFEKLRQEQGINASRSNVVKKDGRYYTEAGSFDNYSQAAYEADKQDLESNIKSMIDLYKNREGKEWRDYYDRRTIGLAGRGLKFETPEGLIAADKLMGLLSMPEEESKKILGEEGYNALKFFANQMEGFSEIDRKAWEDANRLNEVGTVAQGFEGIGRGMQYVSGETLNVFTGSALDDKEILENWDHYTKLRENTDPYATASDGEIEKLSYINELVSEYGSLEGAKEEIRRRSKKVSWGDRQMMNAAEAINNFKPTANGFGGFVAEMIPNMAGTLLAVGATALTKNPTIGRIIGGLNMAGLSLSTAGNSMKEAREYGANNGQVWAKGVADGLIEFITEKIPFDKATRGLFRVGKKRAGDELIQAVENNPATRKELENLLVRANKELNGRLLNGENVKKFMSNMVAEGLSEAAAEGLQTVTEFIYKDPKDYPGIMEIIDNALEGAKGGIFMGAVMGGAALSAERRMNNARRQKQGFVDVAQVEIKGIPYIGEILGQKKNGEYVMLINNEEKTVKKEDVKEERRFSYEQFRNAELGNIVNSAYEEGYSQEPTGVNAMGTVLGYNQARMDVVRALGLAEDADVDAFLNGRSAEEVALGDTDVENTIVNYQMQKARKEGLQERFQQERAKQYEESDRIVDSNANKANPEMTYSTQLNGQPVYITGGDVALNEDGTIDANNSSESLYVKFPDGHVEMISPDKFTEVFTSDRTADLKAVKRAEINAKWKAEFDTAEAQAIEQEKREAGTVFDKADSMGVHRIEILNEGEQMSDILIDGKQEQIPTEELNRWKQETGIQSTDTVADDATVNGTPTESEANVAPTGDNVAPVAPVEMPDVPDFFRLNGKNYEVASRNDDGSVDVVIDGKRETLPAGTDYSTSMPTDKKGDVLYEQMPVERTHEHFVQKVTDDESRALMIEGRRKKAEAERKKFDKKPDPGLDPDKWAEVNRKWEEGKKAAQAKVDYWNEVAKREAEMTRSETREAVENIKPDVVKETAEEFIASHLPKITPESFKRETGLSNEEQSKLVGVISNEGVTIEQAAESIMENYDSELKALGFTGDMQDVRNVIIDVLSQGNPRSYAKNSREAREAENIEQQRAEAEAWAMGTFNMTLEELYVYEETLLPRLTREFEGFDEKEYYDNLAENYENDTTRESESIGRGGEVLQGEQSVPASGAPAVGVRNEGGAVSNDVQGGGQNGVAQEEAINEPVGNSEQLSSSEIPNNQSVAEDDAPGQSGVLLSDEVDENGRQFVLNSKGEIAFGEISEDSGLTPAPILLSEGLITNPATNDGYGLVHIEARHGDQIRNAGYSSVVEFVEEVAKNYEVIREGKDRNGQQTYMLQLTDKHNNTLMVELSGDGTYWNINTAGIFKTSYGKNRKEVYNRHTTAKQPTETVEASQDAEQSGTQATSSMNAPTTSSASEDRNSVSNPQENTQKSGEIAENGGEKMYLPEELAEAKEQLGELNATSAPEFAARLFSIKPWKTLEEANAALKELLASYGETLNGQSLAVIPFLEKAQGLIREYNKSQEPRSVEEMLDNGDKRITNYNSRGEVATVAIERDGKMVSVDSYDEGVLFEHTEYDGNGKAKSVTRYDKQGNVVGTQKYENGKAKTPMQKLADRILDRTEEKRRIPLRERARELEAQVGVKANIIESVDEVADPEARRRIVAGQNVAGWYSKGQVYLYMPNLQDRREIELTYVHEVVAHHGVKKLLGKRFNEFLDGVWNMMSEADRARMLAYVGANENPTLQDMRAAADEYVAELAEKMDLNELERSTWEKIVDWFKGLLENIGFENLTKEDIESMLKASYANLAKGENGDAEIKDRTMFRISRTSQEFDATQAEAVEKRGIVAPGLNEAVVNVVDVPRHDFTGNLKEARAKAKEWAIENYTGKEFDLPENAGKYVISKNAIGKYLDKSAFDKSENAAVHLSVLKELPNVISNSIEAEIHADYSKGDNGERSAENGVNRNDLLVHRIYGAVNIDGKTYRVKTTIHEFRDANTANTPHSYEVTKIELIEDSTVTPNDGINNPLNRSVNSISATKLLEGVEKSYDKGKKVLDESENSSENPQDAESGIRFRKKDSERRQEKRRINDAIDTAAGFVTVGGKKQATKNRLKKEAERKQLAKEMYSSVLKGDFNDVTLAQIDKFIEDATPANPFGRRISQRLPQRMERALRQGARTNAVDALFSRISESAVPANERFSEAGRREIEERKKELLKGWAIATGNWHTDLKEFTDDTEPIGEGKDSKVYSSKDGRYVIKASKGKPYGKRFRPDIDNIALFNDVFRDTRYEILGYGEIDGEFVRILQQPIVDFAESTPLTSEERREYMQSLGFEPLNDANTAFADGEIVIADLQKGNVVRDAAGNISVIDADAKLHTKDVGGDYTYPPVEDDLPEDSGIRFRITPEMDAEYMDAVEDGDISYDEAVHEAKIFEEIHKGSAPIIVLDGIDNWESEFIKAGVKKDEIERFRERLKRSSGNPKAVYLDDADLIFIFNPKVARKEFNGYIWHEDMHKAIREDDRFNRDIAERIINTVVPGGYQEVIEYLNKHGYEGLAADEEALCQILQSFYINGAVGRKGLKDKGVIQDYFNPLIDKVYGRREGRNSNLGNRSVQSATHGTDETEYDGRALATPVEQRTGRESETETQATGGAEETRSRTVEEVIEQQEDNEVRLAMETVTSLGEKLNSPVKIIDDLESVPENRRKWKGWFDPKTGEVVVVIPNHVSTEDAVQTVLHETVAHKGLRAVLGEKFDEFLDGVYKDASQKVKRGINDKFLNALKNGSALTVREATEEYIAELAERDFEGYRDTWNAIRQWFRNFFRNFMNMEITDGELRYLLWKNYNRMKSGPIEIILDRAMEANTGTGKVMARTAETFSTVDSYNKNVKGFKNKVKEGWYDEMRSLKVAQEAIEKELGKELMDSENVYLYANHIPSINKNKKEVFDNKYLRPFTSLLKSLYEKEVNGKKLDEKAIERYTNAKHGIERNREMSVKNALTEVQDGKKVFNDNAYKSWAQERDEVRKKNLPWAEEQRELDRVARKYGAKIRDYSGLTAIFDKDRKMKYAQISDAAYQYVADVENALGKDVKELWGQLKGMTDYSLNEAFESGMMSKATYEHIKQMYKYYVPLRGFAEQTAEDFFDYVESDHSPLNAVVKTAYGRTSEADNIFATILNMANSAIVQGSKNRLKQRLLNLAMRSQTRLLSVDNAWYEKKGDTYEPVNYPDKADEYAYFEERMKDKEKRGEVVRHRPGLDIGKTVAETWNKTQHAVRVKRNGREYVVWVNGDPRLANAVNGMLKEEIGGAIKTVNQFRSKMVTQYSPTFVFTNLLRDVQSASIIYAVRRGTTMLKEFEKNVASNATDMIDLYLKHKRGTLDVNNPKERYFKEFLENGGETGYTEMISIEEYEKKLKELTTGLNMKNGTRRAFEAVGGAVDFANRCVENLSRFSAYQTSREAGISILKSIEDAKEVSVNFNRKGSGAMGQKYAKAGFMFLNPAVQSIAQRILLTKKYPKKMTAVWVGEFILGAAMPVLYSIISAALGDDDDEITGNYYNLSDYRRRSSLCLPLKDGVFHIPLSHESRVLFGLGELCTSFVMGHEKLEDVPIEALNTLAQSLPLNPVEGWMPGKNIIETMTYNFMPDAVKPIAEVVMNRDFAGNTVHNRTDFNEFMPEYMRGKRGTLGAYKKISKYLTSTDGYEKSFLNNLLGGALNLSVMEHLVEGYLGGPYTHVEKVAKAGAWAFGNEEYAEFRNIPIASSFYTSLAKYEDTPTEGRTRRDWENAFRFYKDEVKGYDDKEKTAKNGLKYGEEGADLVLEQMERNGEVLMVDIFNDGNDRLKELYGASDAARKNRDFKRVEDIDQQIYAEKRNIVSLMEQLADDPMVGYTFKRNKIEGPYGERETYGDVRDVNVINDFQKGLKPIIEEREKSADKDKYQKQYNLWRGLENAEEWISNRKSEMKKKPEKADELMTKIREKRAEAIELINNYRNNE